jgi:hypothetical protein
MGGIRIAIAALAVAACGNDDHSAGGAAACEQLKQVVVKCYDDFCGSSGAATPFCKCWSAGQDISAQSCSCIPRDLGPLCTVLNPESVNVSNYNCSAASSTVSHLCN